MSRCPFDCVFCSRKSLRGAGIHMDFALYLRILQQLHRPSVIRLNYSGESLHYPQIIPAIESAKSTGASVELVSALASASPALIRGILQARPTCFSISVHTMDPLQFERLYRFSSLEALKRNIGAVLDRRGPSTTVDFAFVAMQDNLAQLTNVARYAADFGDSGDLPFIQ